MKILVSKHLHYAVSTNYSPYVYSTQRFWRLLILFMIFFHLIGRYFFDFFFLPFSFVLGHLLKNIISMLDVSQFSEMESFISSIFSFLFFSGLFLLIYFSASLKFLFCHFKSTFWANLIGIDNSDGRLWEFPPFFLGGQQFFVNKRLSICCLVNFCRFWKGCFW